MAQAYARSYGSSIRRYEAALGVTARDRYIPADSPTLPWSSHSTSIEEMGPSLRGEALALSRRGHNGFRRRAVGRVSSADTQPRALREALL